MLVHKMLQSAGGTPSDPNFENVTLLLHGDGTNGGQNNTFVDGSANNFTITRNGNTTQGSFSPYGDLWSNYFDGTDWLELADNEAWNFGSGNFTVEAWIYHTAGNPGVGGTQQIVGQQNAAAVTARAWTFATNGTSTNVTGLYGELCIGGTQVPIGASVTIGLNNWHHVAFVRDGSTLRLFLNGAQVATAAVSGTVNNSATPLSIGRNGVSGYEYYFFGHISNLRIIKGAALYTSNFTPSTTPLTAVSGTSLLTCQSNRFRDNSSNNFTITRNGDVSVQRFSPFAPSAAYSAATIGGSGYFDGTGDYLTTPSNTALVMGTGQFWFEAWIYMPSAPASQYVVLGTNEGTILSSALTVRIQPSALRVDRHGVVAYDSSAVTWQYNAWQHIAVGRDSGNTLRFFVNGQAVGTRASTTDNFAGNSSAIGYIPIDNAPTTAFKGYIASARLLKGECLYTTTFTPPTAPLTAITNTSLLLNFTNAAIFDNAMMADLETVGNAQISTSVKKYGTGSLAFDGSGDGLYRPSSDLFNFGSGSFTIEFWMYFNSKTGYQTLISYGYSPLTATGWVAQTGNGDGKIIFYRVNASTTTVIATDAGLTVNTGQWYHIAIVRNGTTTTIYRDGTNVGSGTDTSIYSASANFYTGGGSSTGFDGGYFNGYIDDLRITKGVARYTGNFTPPGPLANK